MMKTKELMAGDLVWEFDPSSNTLQPGTVGSVQVLKGRGLYNPHTLSGTLIVDNVLALSFTEVLPRSMNLQLFLTAPLAFFSWLCPSVKLTQQLNSMVLQALGK